MTAQQELACMGDFLDVHEGANPEPIFGNLKPPVPVMRKSSRTEKNKKERVFSIR